VYGSDQEMGMTVEMTAHMTTAHLSLTSKLKLTLHCWQTTNFKTAQEVLLIVPDSTVEFVWMQQTRFSLSRAVIPSAEHALSNLLKTLLNTLVLVCVRSVECPSLNSVRLNVKLMFIDSPICLLNTAISCLQMSSSIPPEAQSLINYHEKQGKAPSPEMQKYMKWKWGITWKQAVGVSVGVIVGGAAGYGLAMALGVSSTVPVVGWVVCGAILVGGFIYLACCYYNNRQGDGKGVYEAPKEQHKEPKDRSKRMPLDNAELDKFAKEVADITRDIEKEKQLRASTSSDSQ